MDESEADQIAKEIDAIRAAVQPVVDGRDHFPCAMALTLMAAHHVLHDGAGEEEWLAVCKSAWHRSLAIHQNCRSVQ